MSLLRPRQPFDCFVTLCFLASAEDFPWASDELEGQLMVSHPVPQVRDYSRSPLATLLLIPALPLDGCSDFPPMFLRKQAIV